MILNTTTTLKNSDLAIISIKDLNYQLLKNNPNTSIYYVNHDLYSQFWAQSLNSKEKLISFSRTEQVMLSVLKNKNSLGVAFLEDLGLIVDQVRKTLSVHEIIDFGKIYLLASPSLIKKRPNIKNELLDFHNDWNDPAKEYHYLNYFNFRLWKGSDKQAMHVSDAFQYFLSTIQVK